jgi:hypothetical protein
MSGCPLGRAGWLNDIGGVNRRRTALSCVVDRGRIECPYQRDLVVQLDGGRPFEG